MTTSFVYGTSLTKKRSRATKAQMVDREADIVDLASEHGPCSIRHIYYQAVVATVQGITKSRSGYTKVQRAILKLRRSGRIPYELIVDSTRWMRKPHSWDSVEEVLAHVARTYRRDLWTTSEWQVEVWAESDSIASTVYPITEKWDVPLMVCRGQSSETFAWGAAQAWCQTPLRQPVVLYIGDHDPAGLEIENSLQDKLGQFAQDVFPGIRWKRIGVTWEQVVDLDLPGTTPKKAYGFPVAVEAEALPPRLLKQLLDEEITRYVDQHRLDVINVAEASEREILRNLARGGVN